MGKKSFWKILKTKYKLVLHDENKLEHIASSHISVLGIITFFFLVLIIFAALSFAIAIYSPLREYLPGYLNSEMRKNLLNSALRLDSLQQEVNKQNLYISNIQDIFKGKIKPDTIQSIDSLTVLRSEELMEHTLREEEFTRRFEEQEKYNLTSQAAAVGGIQRLNLYPPVRGTVAATFSTADRHYGVDLAANPGESVVAILDGTVIVSDYTSADGSVIVIQHNQDLISLYKNCRVLLKKVGDKVQAGEVIALPGKMGEEDTENRLHMELWHKGNPLNPTQYIAF